MQQRNIFAYTALGTEYPEHVSVNERNGQTEITVRAAKQPPTTNLPYVMPGHTACITLSRELLRALRDALTTELERV